MTIIQKLVSWIFWFLWVVASTVGFTVAATAFTGIGDIVAETTPSLLGAAIFCTTAGTGASLPGFLHWFILRRWFPRAAWWIFASGAGSILGFIVLGWGLAVADTGRGIVDTIVLPNMAFVGAGTAVGVLQWLVLRRWVSRAGWWILASSVSWAGATWAYASITRANDVNVPLGGAVSGAISGVIMGLVLVWLLRKMSPDEPFAPHRAARQNSRSAASRIKAAISGRSTSAIVAMGTKRFDT